MAGQEHQRQKDQAYLEKVILPALHLLHKCESAVNNLMGKIEELALLSRGIRGDVIEQRASQLGTALATVSSEHKNLALQLGADQAYKDSWLALVADAQDVIELLVQGAPLPDRPLFNASNPDNQKFADFVATLDYGGQRRDYHDNEARRYIQIARQESPTGRANQKLLRRRARSLLLREKHVNDPSELSALYRAIYERINEIEASTLSRWAKV
jgi:hypothetical protein